MKPAKSSDSGARRGTGIHDLIAPLKMRIHSFMPLKCGKEPRRVNGAPSIFFGSMKHPEDSPRSLQLILTLKNSPAMRNRQLILSSGLLALGLFGPAIHAAESAANVDRGRTLFQQSCAPCHAPGPVTPFIPGPSLLSVVGRRAAAVPNFSYTSALTNSGLTWDAATLDRFLANPMTAVPARKWSCRWRLQRIGATSSPIWPP